MECGAKAYIAGCTDDESARLLKMRESLLALAENADWLNGKHTDLRLSTAAE